MPTSRWFVGPVRVFSVHSNMRGLFHLIIYYYIISEKNEKYTSSSEQLREIDQKCFFDQNSASFAKKAACV